ncbi:hypothetical protein BD410DRAFT_759246 [Rickenella mellea]|uniref:PH-domain-containing protein n=1 Tax=Rickenella mellea TaxID=50990 RepID=A0A4R5XFX6_9AGAM|nr:hypothetical protein BD410DRAFT_759246 [Rickenella mellea]
MPEYVYALHDFLPEHEDEISFRAGERIEIVEKDDMYGDGWWQGRNLAGKVGLFPQSYATSTPNLVVPHMIPGHDAPQPTLPPSGDIGLQALSEEPDSDSALSNQEKDVVESGGRGADGVMKATLTDVQEAIEQLGRNDRDGARSFSFASTRDGDTTDHELTDRETDTEAEKVPPGLGVVGGEGETWHKGARHNLAEKARAAAEIEKHAEPSPPLEFELSDESEGEDDPVHDPVFPRRDHEHISEEEDEEEDRPNGLRPSLNTSNGTPRPVSFDSHVQPSEEFIVPESDVPQTVTARRTTFPEEETKFQPPAELVYNPTAPFSMPTPTTPMSLGAVAKMEQSTPSAFPKPEPLSPVVLPNPHSTASSQTSALPSPPPSTPGAQRQAPSSEQDTLRTPTTHPSEWSIEEVVEWAKSKNFDSAICAKFVEHEITGDVLLDLDVNLLKTELEIPAFGKRMRIANAIAELRRPPSFMSERERDRDRDIPPQVIQHSRGVSQSQSVPSSAHPSLNAPHAYSTYNPTPFSAGPPFMNNGNGNGIMGNGFANAQNANDMYYRRDSDPGSSMNASVPDVDQKGMMGLPKGLGMTPTTSTATATPTLNDSVKPTKNRPAHLTLSPSDGAIGSTAAASIDDIIQSAGLRSAAEDRGALSEGEGNPLEARSSRRRMFGRGQSTSSHPEAKLDSASIRSGNSPTIVSSVPATPSSLTKGSPDLGSTRRPRNKRSADTANGERHSIFGGSLIGSLSKSRKPAPRYSSFNSEEVHAEKSHLSLSRLYMGSQSKKGRPQSDPSSRKSDATIRRSNEKESDKESKERDPAVLRKRTTSQGELRPSEGALSLQPGQSVLDQIGEPDHCGYLRKRGERYNTWNTRYFVLKGIHLYYLKSDSPLETKIKGWIDIRGYKVIVDENVNPGRYGFRLIHDWNKTHFFSSDEQSLVREWMKALMKATIGRDYTKPVISSCNIPTIPLAVAQTMNPAPRPPSPTARDATQKALRRENPNQLSSRDARVLMGLPSADTNGVDQKGKGADTFFTLDTAAGMPPSESPMSMTGPTPPRPSREPRRSTSIPFEASMPVDVELFKWANDYLPSKLQVKDPNGPMYSGLALFRLAEGIKGMPSDPPISDSVFPSGPNDDRVEGLIILFDFLLDNDVKMGSVSINDIKYGKRDKVVQVLKALKFWDEKRKAIARSIGRTGAYAGQFMALDHIDP